MKPDRIQFAPWLDDGQDLVHFVVKHYKANSLNQAAIFAGVFSDLVEDPSAHDLTMIARADKLTVVVASADGGPITKAQIGLLAAFDAIHAMFLEGLFEEDEEHEEDAID